MNTTAELQFTKQFTSEETVEIAKTIAQQIGGLRRLKAFAGAYNFKACECNDMMALRMTLQENAKEADFLYICLNGGADLYEFIFTKYTGGKETIIYHENSIYCDMLMDIFESTTGMYLRF